MSRRKTLLAGEIPNFDVQDDAVDDDEEKRRRISERFNPSSIRIQRKELPRQDSENRQSTNTPAANKTLTTPSAVAPKPSNEQLSCLYNNCVKLLNENKINVKNAFQLKLIDYMSDIVLNKEIVGGVTNFQVVGCTIDVGTKIYAARVDALHQNTYQMLSGLGHNANPDEENGDSNVTTNRLDGDDDNFDNDNENDEHAGNKKAKAKKKRMKKSSQIAENLDSITSKLRDEFQDEDLYFSKISTCIENEAVAGTLLNKLHFIDDSFKIYINAEDKLCSTSLTPSSFKLSAGVEINCKDIIDIYRAKQQDLRNLKLCSELSSFRFIGWNLDSNDEISKFVEQVSAPDEDLEMHRFDANNLQTSHLNISIHAPGNVDVDIDDMNDMNMDGDVENFEKSMDHMTSMQKHHSGIELFDKIDDIRSLNSVAELTTLVSQSPNEYSYFDKFKMHNLRSNIRQFQHQLAVQSSNNNNNPLEPVKSTATVRNKREAPKIDLSIVQDRMKFFKITKKAIYLCDRTIEKRSEKPCRIETERQYEYNPRELFQPYWKPISAKIYSDIDICENFLMNDEPKSTNKNKQTEQEQSGENERQRDFQNGYEDDDGHLGGIDDDFDIPCTAGTNEPFFTQNGGEFVQSQQIDMMANGNDMFGSLQRFDGDNLIEAPLQVNAINIEYAKTSKNIDVRRLKQVIWSLLNTENDKENIDDSVNNDTSKRSSQPININASLKAIYKQLKPPLISQKVYDDLSICIVFQMLLFLANEHSLLLKNDPVGSDVIITNA